MATKKIEFQGKDVAEAINKACEALNTSQEELDIEVLHTGSVGIFGLCRRNARLRVSRKADRENAAAPGQATKAARKKPTKAAPPAAATPANETKPAEPATPISKKPAEKAAPAKSPQEKKAQKPSPKTAPPLPEKATSHPTDAATAENQEAPELARIDVADDDAIAAAETTQTDLGRILELMGLPSEVTVTRDNNSIVAHITGDHVQEIIGPEGRTLDSLQYLLRKMISKKHSEKTMLSLDAGDFRANRLQELEQEAQKLAAEVKQTGKTRSIPALNPSERRVVHLALQEDKEIRSRSVGDGLFKKVLIYKPGAVKKNGSRKRRGPRQGQTATKKPDAAE